MPGHRFPRIPYDEVQSEFIRGEIRRSDFSDLESRRYVNKLVWIEWITTEGLSPRATGISGFGAVVHRWQLAAEYPDEYDIIRRELGAPTRAEHGQTRPGSEPGEFSEDERNDRRRRAREHAREWQFVQESG